MLLCCGVEVCFWEWCCGWSGCGREEGLEGFIGGLRDSAFDGGALA